VNLDGATATAPPGGVPTMAIWGTGVGDLSRTIPGAVNLYNSDESHTQTVTSARTFAATYRFFTGRAPRTTDITPQPLIRLAGRGLLFPTNAGAEGARLDVYLVSGATGRRLLPRPVYSKALTADGSFGPFLGLGAAHYEFQLTQDGIRQHFYYQPFERTDLLIRLLTNHPGTGIDALTQNSATTTNLIVTRYKEFWGDQGAADDTLTIDGTNVISAAAEPRAKLAIAILTYDVGLDGVSHPDTGVPALASLPFITGTDLFLGAATPPTRTVTLVDRQRAGTGRPDVLHVPDWPSATDRISVQFNDFTRGESAAPQS
jgi:Lipase C-terminal domain